MLDLNAHVARLKAAQEVLRQYPCEAGQRQPVNTVYGGAHILQERYTEEAGRARARGYGVAVNLNDNRVYVSMGGDGQSLGNTVVVLDGATNAVVPTVPLPAGSEPRQLLWNPRNGSVYVSLRGSAQVAVIDSTDALAQMISLGAGQLPEQLAVDVVRNRVYVTEHNTASLGVIDAPDQYAGLDLFARHSGDRRRGRPRHRTRLCGGRRRRGRGGCGRRYGAQAHSHRFGPEYGQAICDPRTQRVSAYRTRVCRAIDE